MNWDPLRTRTKRPNRRSGIKVSKILGRLSIWRRYGWVVGFLCVIRKMFPYMSIHEDQARLCRTCRFLTPLVDNYLLLKDLSSVNGGDASISFFGGIVLWKLHWFSRVHHPLCHHSRAFISFCEADNLVGVVGFLSHLFSSLNFFVKNTPISCLLLCGFVVCN